MAFFPRHEQVIKPTMSFIGILFRMVQTLMDAAQVGTNGAIDRPGPEDHTTTQAEQITQGEHEIARLENLTTGQEKEIKTKDATIHEQQAVIESLRRDLVELRTQAKADAARIKEQSALLTALTKTKPSKAKPANQSSTATN